MKKISMLGVIFLETKFPNSFFYLAHRVFNIPVFVIVSPIF